MKQLLSGTVFSYISLGLFWNLERKLAFKSAHQHLKWELNKNFDRRQRRVQQWSEGVRRGPSPRLGFGCRISARRCQGLFWKREVSRLRCRRKISRKFNRRISATSPRFSLKAETSEVKVHENRVRFKIFYCFANSFFFSLEQLQSAKNSPT